MQEVAFALATAIAVLDAVRDSGQVPPERFGDVVAPHLVLRQRRRAVRRGDVQDARVRRALGRDHPRALRRRPTPKQRRFRYGVQVNSLGLTEAQPENNVQRIVLEMLGVTLSRDARARAVQLPAWNEALGLPRPWDQQWSLRMQQVLAFESDLLEYEDLFDGLARRRGQGRRASSTAPAPRSTRSTDMGGAVAAVESGYLKTALVALARRRRRAGSSPARTWSSGSTGSPRPSRSPLTADLDAAIETVDPAVEAAAVAAVAGVAGRARDAAAVEAALDRAARPPRAPTRT